MICRSCADRADAWPGIGHPPDVCDDHGRDIRACGCAHGAEALVQPPQDPQESPR